MTVSKLLSLIPFGLIDFLEVETDVNHQIKKLDGSVMFKLILFSMLESNKASLRIMESFANSSKFRHVAGLKRLDTKYNSIRDRICSINSDFFLGVFQGVFEVYNTYLGEQNALVKADSTLVGIASSLASWSMVGGGTNKGDKKHVKYSVAMKGSLPCNVRVFTQSEMNSEDKALKELILNSDFIDDQIITFDKGLQSRKTFDTFTSRHQIFVSRLKKEKIKHVNDVSLEIAEKPLNSTVTIHRDVLCNLFEAQNKPTQHLYRIITATIDQSGETIVFITNSTELSSYEVASIYQQRWEIEVFFKFIKQHLNVGHLVSRNENGIRVMIYMTMILAILLTVYKKLNRIASNKIAKFRFELELDNLLTKEIVILCGGDPSRAPHLFSDS